MLGGVLFPKYFLLPLFFGLIAVAVVESAETPIIVEYVTFVPQKTESTKFDESDHVFIWGFHIDDQMNAETFHKGQLHATKKPAAAGDKEVAEIEEHLGGTQAHKNSVIGFFNTHSKLTPCKKGELLMACYRRARLDRSKNDHHKDTVVTHDGKIFHLPLMMVWPDKRYNQQTGAKHPEVVAEEAAAALAEGHNPPQQEGGTENAAEKGGAQETNPQEGEGGKKTGEDRRRR